MNCPECGQFMKRIVAFEIGKDVWESFMWWVCDDDQARHYYEVDPIPAPQYQWLWNCEGIPAEDLQANPALFAEYREMWNDLPVSIKRQYARQSPERVLQAQ